MEKRKYKVLMVHNHYQIPGGEDIVVENEKNLLEEHGHKVTLYTRDNSEISHWRLVEKLKLPIDAIFSIKTYRDIRRIIKMEKIDIVHVHNTLNLISPSVYYASFSCNIPVILTLHNFRLLCPAGVLFREGTICEKCVTNGLRYSVIHRCYRNSLSQSLLCAFSWSLYRNLGLYKRLSYICLTDFNKNKMMMLNQYKVNIWQEKVFVKPHFTVNRNRVIPYNLRKKEIVYAGRLDETKGIKLLFEAWRKLEKDSKYKAINLVICGTGPLETWCRSFIENNNIKRVCMMGFVKHEELLKIITNALATIMPTQLYEGFGMNIIESFSCGTPVIGSDLGNTGNLIKEGYNGWKFQHNSIDSLIDTIGKIEDIIDSTYKDYLNKYTSEINYRKLMEIYQQICK